MIKKILMVCGVLFMLVTTVVFAMAQEADWDDLGSAPNTVNPDSPFYGLDQWWDNYRLDKAEGANEKARIRLEIANERMMEIRAMAKKGKSGAMEKAVKDHDEKVQGLIGDKNVDSDVRRTIQESVAHHVFVLEKVLETAPESAQEGLLNALKQSQKHFSSANGNVDSDHKASIDALKSKFYAGKLKSESLRIESKSSDFVKQKEVLED